MVFTAGPDDGGRRLDRILRKALPDYSLSLIHRLLRQKKIKVNGKPAAPGEHIQAGMFIQISHQSFVNRKKIKVNKTDVNYRHGQVNNKDISKPVHSAVNYRYERGNYKDMPKPACHNINYRCQQVDENTVLWRGSGIIVFNKPAGLASHGNNSLDTLVNAWLSGKIPPSLSFKPGPLHRLDKPSSGAIAFSESLPGARRFSRLLRERKVIKTYLAIVEGRVTGAKTWKDDLVRDKAVKKTFVNSERRTVNREQKLQNAVTMVKALAAGGPYSLIEARIITGRTHQIRSQAAAHGHPLAGDTKYGGKKYAGGLFLHAWKLELAGPVAGFPQPLVAPLPSPFQRQIEILFPKYDSQNLLLNEPSD